MDDTKYLTAVTIEEMGIEVPRFKIEKPSLRMLLGLVNVSRTLLRKPPLTSGDYLFPELLLLLVKGYRSYKETE